MQHFALFDRFNRAKQICQTKQNAAFHETPCNLRNNKSIKIVKYDKGNGICIMSSQDYLDKLNVIVKSSLFKFY